MSVIKEAMRDPEARILLVGTSIQSILSRQVGADNRGPPPSSILALAPASFQPVVRLSRRTLEFPNGARVSWKSAADPSSLRGSSYSFVLGRDMREWGSIEAFVECRHAARLLTTRMREEKRPARLMLVTRPAPTVLLRHVVDSSRSLVRTTLSTYDNEHNLSPEFVRWAHELRGTTQGRREFGGELIFSLDDVDAGASTPKA